MKLRRILRSPSWYFMTVFVSQYIVIIRQGQFWPRNFYQNAPDNQWLWTKSNELLYLSKKPLPKKCSQIIKIFKKYTLKILRKKWFIWCKMPLEKNDCFFLKISSLVAFMSFNFTCSSVTKFYNRTILNFIAWPAV